MTGLANSFYSIPIDDFLCAIFADYSEVYLVAVAVAVVIVVAAALGVVTVIFASAVSSLPAVCATSVVAT
ncbi:MAG: hypothetical protein OSB14_08440, partial [Planctomycetota bacterium]|nr:hypothetical protein [Planctomycetota bacterium]